MSPQKLNLWSNGSALNDVQMSRARRVSLRTILNLQGKAKYVSTRPVASCIDCRLSPVEKRKTKATMVIAAPEGVGKFLDAHRREARNWLYR